MKIVLCGPPHSGKSCLRHGLKEAIIEINNAPYPYIITACPDGEGSWFHLTAGQDETQAKTLKDAQKEKFTYEQTEMRASWVQACQEALALIDVGGIPDDKNEYICATATHAILLFNSPETLPEWHAFCQKTNLQLLAEIHSDYHAKTDTALTINKHGIYQGAIHCLERGDNTLGQRPTIQALAKIIVNKVQQEQGDEQFQTYLLHLTAKDQLKVSFGQPAQNDAIVRDAAKALEQLIQDKKVTGGELIRINGPATLPVAMLLAHRLSHLYQTVACYDPKLSKYVVAIAHSDQYQVGDLIP